jgi:hypothetical protein
MVDWYIDLLLVTSGRSIELVTLEVSAVISIVGFLLLKCEPACEPKTAGNRRHPALLDCRSRISSEKKVFVLFNHCESTDSLELYRRIQSIRNLA